MAPPFPATPAELDVSVILPVHNEAGHLDAELERIRAGVGGQRLQWEIIVVDDASTDGSTDHLTPDDHLRIFRLAVNQGSGGARRIGSEAAQGEVVVWTDADMTYPNGDIPQLVAQLEGADQVVGARTTEEGTHKVLRTGAKWFIRVWPSTSPARRSPTSTRAIGRFAGTWAGSTPTCCPRASRASPR